jgi:hypothetical protein
MTLFVLLAELWEWFTAPWKTATHLDELEVRMLRLETGIVCCHTEPEPPDNFRP